MTLRDIAIRFAALPLDQQLLFTALLTREHAIALLEELDILALEEMLGGSQPLDVRPYIDVSFVELGLMRHDPVPRPTPTYVWVETNIWDDGFDMDEAMGAFDEEFDERTVLAGEEDGFAPWNNESDCATCSAAHLCHGPKYKDAGEEDLWHPDVDLDPFDALDDEDGFTAEEWAQLSNYARNSWYGPMDALHSSSDGDWDDNTDDDGQFDTGGDVGGDERWLNPDDVLFDLTNPPIDADDEVYMILRPLNTWLLSYHNDTLVLEMLKIIPNQPIVITF